MAHLAKALSPVQRMVKAQTILGYQFQNAELLQQALTITKTKQPGRLAALNKRLALVGDHMISTSLVERWYQRPDLYSLDWALMKGVTFSNENFSKVAFKKGLYLCTIPHTVESLTPGSWHGETPATIRLLSDTVEAVLGAVYLDAKASGHKAPLEEVEMAAVRLGLVPRPIMSESEKLWAFGQVKAGGELRKYFFSEGHHLRLAALAHEIHLIKEHTERTKNGGIWTAPQRIWDRLDVQFSGLSPQTIRERLKIRLSGFVYENKFLRSLFMTRRGDFLPTSEMGRRFRRRYPLRRLLPSKLLKNTSKMLGRGVTSKASPTSPASPVQGQPRPEDTKPKLETAADSGDKATEQPAVPVAQDKIAHDSTADPSAAPGRGDAKPVVAARTPKASRLSRKKVATAPVKVAKGMATKPQVPVVQKQANMAKRDSVTDGLDKVEATEAAEAAKGPEATTGLVDKNASPAADVVVAPAVSLARRVLANRHREAGGRPPIPKQLSKQVQADPEWWMSSLRDRINKIRAQI